MLRKHVRQTLHACKFDPSFQVQSRKAALPQHALEPSHELLAAEEVLTGLMWAGGRSLCMAASRGFAAMRSTMTRSARSTRHQRSRGSSSSALTRSGGRPGAPPLIKFARTHTNRMPKVGFLSLHLQRRRVDKVSTDPRGPRARSMPPTHNGDGERTWFADGRQPLPQDLAHIPFFANLPAELRAICCEEQYDKCAVSGENVLYRQGSTVEEGAGLYVILEGAVWLHAHDRGSHQGSRAGEESVGPERLRLGVGDAFGDEVLHRQLFGGSIKRSTSAVAPVSTSCVVITSKRVLCALATFIGALPSAFYFLHPLPCLQALRTAPDERGRTEELRIVQCLDGLGVFGKKCALAHSVSFREVERGQVVFLEADRIDACYFVAYGQVVLSQHGASPDTAQPANPCPLLGHVVDELCAGDVLIDPAPWFHGVWPCSAVASTKAGILGIPRMAVEDLKSQGVFFNSRQIVKLLGKQAARTRLENSRIAQFLSSFRSMRGVPMQKRVEMAQLLTLVEHQPGDYFPQRADHELVLLSGAIRIVSGDVCDVSRPHKLPASSQNIPLEEHHGIIADKDPTPCVVVDQALSSSHERLQAWIDAAVSFDVAMDIACSKTPGAFLQDLENIEEQSHADDRCNQLLSIASGLLPAFETAKLASWLKICRQTKKSGAHDSLICASADLFPGDVIGWHMFPCRVPTEKSYFSALSPAAFAVLAHCDVEGLQAANIFRRGSACISLRAQASLTKALRSPPPRNNPEDIADTVAGLQNTSLLSIVRQSHPEAFGEMCGQTLLRELAPGDLVRWRGEPVDEVYIIIKGKLESVVIAGMHEGGERESSWAQREECIAAYGCGDSVGFADMLGGTWTSVLRAGHLGCSLAVVPSKLLAIHVDLLMSSLGAAVSPENCRGVLSVPRMFTTQDDLMLLRMFVASSPSFAGLSSDCMDRVCAKVTHRHVSPDQLLHVQGDQAETFALVVSGLLASYSGLPGAIKAVLCPQAGAYISSNPFHRVADASVSVRLHWSTDKGADDQDLEREDLWEERDVEIDEEGNLSCIQGQSRVVAGNVGQELTDLDAPDWLLQQCSASLRGVTDSRSSWTRSVTTPAPSLQRVPSSGATRKMRKQASQNRPASGGGLAVGRRSLSNGPIKVGQASNRIVFHFGFFVVSLWSASSIVLETLVLCAMQKWTAGRDHALGDRGKVISAEGEIGTDVVRSFRYYSRAPPAPDVPSDQPDQSRPSTAGPRPSSAQAQAAQAQAAGQRAVAPDAPADQQTANEALKTASSVVVLHPGELLMLQKGDVEQAILEFRAQLLQAAITSLGEGGAALARDMKPQDFKIVAACLEPCKFEVQS